MVDVCSAEGIGKLSVSNVTRQAGCTRSLFYHYFPSKEAALEAALDYTIDSFIEQLRDWNTRRVPGDIEGALEMFVEQLRTSVIKTPKLSYTIAVGSNAALFAEDGPHFLPIQISRLFLGNSLRPGLNQTRYDIALKSKLVAHIVGDII